MDEIRIGSRLARIPVGSGIGRTNGSGNIGAEQAAKSFDRGQPAGLLFQSLVGIGDDLLGEPVEAQGFLPAYLDLFEWRQPANRSLECPLGVDRPLES
jgi:hypothetical protein